MYCFDKIISVVTCNTTFKRCANRSVATCGNKIEDGGHSTSPNRSNRSGKSGLNPGRKDEKFVSQGVGKDGKNIEDSNQNTDVEGSIRDGQVVFNHSGNGGFKDSAVLNTLYQNEGENSNNNDGVVDGLISDDGEVVCMNIQEGCGVVLTEDTKEVPVSVKQSVVNDAHVVFDKMPVQQIVDYLNNGLGGVILGVNKDFVSNLEGSKKQNDNIPVDNEVHGVDEMLIEK
ncbi:uncharacterized protein LOC141695925 [Apium graveolens]|uniref:uncharacterized protein LOC141695925 n=1 Tax=Apium graveolens TaxID=4045 RepID=UPI003D7967EB